MGKVASYSEKDIGVLIGLEGVRTKPHMYIGLTDSAGLGTLVREAADNAVDEFKAGRNTSVTILVDTKKNQVWVLDSGQGMPVGELTLTIEGRKVKESAMKSILSRLHAGGKLKPSDAYKNAGGTHGVGIKAVNALSTFFEVHTYRDRSWYVNSYKDSKEVKKVQKAKAPVLPFGQKMTSGTCVTWTPDMKFFDKGSKLSLDYVRSWCELAAYLSAGLKVKLIVDGKKPEEWHYKKGVQDYLTGYIEKHKLTPMGKPLVLLDEALALDVALSFTDAEGDNMLAYTNAIFNKNGGFHVTLIRNALYDNLVPYAAKKQEFRRDDVLEGLVGIINAKFDAPRFSSQDKAELADARIDDPKVYEPIYAAVEQFFAANKKLARDLCDKASRLREAKAGFANDKKAIAALKVGANTANGGLPAKFRGSKTKNPMERETFLVEGDSAGGTAKKAADRYYQEVLPLRGKVLNVMKQRDPNAAFSSDEVRFMLRAAFSDPTKKNPMDHLRTGKIIFLTDADVDGRHIETLGTALYLKYAPDLFTKNGGIIYTVDSPKFVYKDRKTGVYYTAKTRSGLWAKMPKGANRGEVVHMKGWGEADDAMLRQIAFDPKTRTLKKIVLKHKESMANFKKLMGEDTEYRKQLLGITEGSED